MTLDANDLKTVDKKAGEAATKAADTAVDNKIKTVFGVSSLDLGAIGSSLKSKVRDQAIDTKEGLDIKMTEVAGIPVPVLVSKTHRYTIEVPDEGEGAVLNLGQGDKGRDITDKGIVARTSSHIHLHTRHADGASMLAMGGPTTSKRDEVIDPKEALAKNEGISAVTNGNLWAESRYQLNLVSREAQASLRAQEGNVRIQADAKTVEVGAGKEVVIGAKKNVKIVAESSVDPDDNAYAEPFSGALVDKASAWSDKDVTSLGDILTAAHSLFTGLAKTNKEYKPGKNKDAQYANEVAKGVVDIAKIFSSVLRFRLGKGDVGGQIKIVAETFASLTGEAAASVYGRYSATLSSLASASVVGGTAGLKGLTWASVWAGLGVSVKTISGKASLGSDRGKASISGGAGVSVTTPKTVSIGGDESAELKSAKGSIYLAGAQSAKMAVGTDAGMALTIAPKEAYLGDASDCDEIKGKPERKTYICVNRDMPGIEMKTKGCSILLKEDQLIGSAKESFSFSAKNVSLRGSKKTFIG